MISIVDSFVGGAAELEDLEDGWLDFMSEFFASIEHIVGKQAIVKSSRTTDTASVPTSFLEELESLRTTVEKLSEERTSLKAELNEKTALGNTLRSLPIEVDKPETPRKGEKDGFSGVIQRLVQKEKQVLQLQGEVDRLSSAKGRLDDEEKAKKERAEKNRQWSNLMEEIAKNKAQLADQEVLLESRAKENTYLKRALESVYTRFQASLDAPSSTNHAQERSTATMDAELMASRTIEALAQRDGEIASLKEEIGKLKLAAMAPIPRSPSDPFVKHGLNIISPPPASPPRLSLPLPTSRQSNSSPAPPPPPPPPPAPSLQTTSPTSHAPSKGLAPPPPPPPPPPPAPLGLTSPGTRTPSVVSMNGFPANIKVVRKAPKPPGASPTSPAGSSAPSPPPPPPVIRSGPSAPMPPPPPPPGFAKASSGGPPVPPPPPALGAPPRNISAGESCSRRKAIAES